MGPRVLTFSVIVSLWALPSSEAAPLSNSGCACTSGCSKTRMTLGLSKWSKFEWCFVDSSCLVGTGWDWCGDTQNLYAKVLKEKKDVELSGYSETSRREGAERQNLLEAKKRKEAEEKTNALRAQLEKNQEALQKETKHRKDAEKYAAALANKLHNKVDPSHEEADMKSNGTAPHSKLSIPVPQELSGGQLKLTRDLEAGVQAVQNKQKQQVAEAKRQLKQQLDEAQRQVRQSEMKRKDAEMTNAATQKQLEGALKKLAGTEKKLKDVERTSTNVQKQIQSQLKEASQKEAEMNTKLKAAELEIEGHQQLFASTGTAMKTIEEAAPRINEYAVSDLRQKKTELRTIRLAARSAVRGGSGVVQKDA